ncbi:MAG: hypothetical protein WDN29_16370 [Methylovirgula sp.]
MSFMFLPDFIKHAVASAPATGNAVLGSAIPGFQSLANSPNAPASGSVVPYMFSDSSSKWERGYGTLTLSGSTWTLARTQVIESSAGVGTAENLSSAAQFWISIFSEDILNRMNKSVLRNPAIDIAQRGASGTVAAGTTAYTADGWIITATGAAVNWSVVYNQNIAGNALRISCASGLTGVKVSHRVESTIASRLLTAYKQVQPCCKQFILSNQTAAAIAPKFSGGYASARDNFSTVTPDVAATAMQSIPSAGTGQCALIFVPNVALTNGYQSDVDFAGALNAASGYVDFSLADLRVSPGIEPGITAAPPPAEVRPISEETALCYRYLEVILITSSAVIFVSQMFNGVSTNMWTTWWFQSTKRAAPSFSAGSGTAWGGSAPTIFSTANYIQLGNPSGGPFDLSGTAGTIGAIASSEL